MRAARTSMRLKCGARTESCSTNWLRRSFASRWACRDDVITPLCVCVVARSSDIDCGASTLLPWKPQRTHTQSCSLIPQWTDGSEADRIQWHHQETQQQPVMTSFPVCRPSSPAVGSDWSFSADCLHFISSWWSPWWTSVCCFFFFLQLSWRSFSKFPFTNSWLKTEFWSLCFSDFLLISLLRN